MSTPYNTLSLPSHIIDDIATGKITTFGQLADILDIDSCTDPGTDQLMYALQDSGYDHCDSCGRIRLYAEFDRSDWVQTMDNTYWCVCLDCVQEYIDHKRRHSC